MQKRSSIQGRNISPRGVKGVSFTTKPDPEQTLRRENSSSTAPLRTDTASESDPILEHGLLDEDFISPSSELHSKPYGYDPKRLNRIRLRREHELEEFNFGIDFS